MKTNKEAKKQAELQNLSQALNKARLNRTLTPKRTFNVGDKVEWISSFNKLFTIVEVLDDGKTYKIQNEMLTTYLNWQELRFPVNRKESFISPNKYDLHFSSREINALITAYYSFGINMNPEYQRPLVWTLEDKQKLIHSIFNKIDIGKFVLIHLDFKENEPMYEILDGKQRLSTLIEFVNDGFQYNGLFYSELSNQEIRFFERTLVSWADVQNEKLSMKDKYDYFLNLNTSGVPQDANHLSELQRKMKDL